MAGREGVDIDAAEANRLLESIQDAYFSIDRQWRLTYVNRAAEQFFQTSRADILGKGLLERFPRLKGSPGHRLLEQALASGERARLETISVVTGAPIELDVHPSPQGVSVFLRDVSERWRLTDILREREEQLRLAEESAGIGVWDIDIASDTVRGTPQFFRIMGLEPAAAAPMDVLRGLRFDEDRERVNKGYRDAVATGTDLYDSEYKIRRPDGEIRWIFGRGKVIRDASGEPVRFSGVDIDITERKSTQRALADSEDRLQMAVEAANLGIWDWNVLTNEMRWTERGKALFGFPPDRPVSFAQVRDATHPEDLPRTSAMARRALDPAERLKEPYEYRILRADGEVRWMLAHGEARFAVVDGVERGVRYTGTIQDITARKQAESRVQRSEARLRLAVDAARLAVWGYDIVSDAIEATPDLNRLLGFPEGQPLDIVEIRKRYFPGDNERLRVAAEKALALGERYFRAEYRYRRPDGELRWFLLRAEIFLGLDGKPTSALGVLMDITEQKELEEHRALMLGELQHRVKNTLSVVNAMASQTFRKPEEQAPLATFFARLAALGQAHDLLTEENWQSADLADVVNRALAPHRIGGARFDIAGPRLRLTSRQALSLVLALNELATNAAKYGALSNEVGRVAIGWGVTPADSGPMLTLSWAESGGPAVVPPARLGFGTRLIKESLAADFGGKVSLAYAPSGVVCELTASWRTN